MSTNDTYNGIDEYAIRRWFMCVDIEQARDTVNVCKGIVDGRLMEQPKRKRRSDAGSKREPSPTIAEMSGSIDFGGPNVKPDRD